MKALIISAMLFVAASSFTTTTPIATKPTRTTNTNCFSVFRVHRQAKNTELTLAVSVPDVVQFVIERSYDGQYFDAIDQMPGAVGACKYKDNSVFPGYIYYRITALKTDGSFESSNVEVVRIVQH